MGAVVSEKVGKDSLNFISECHKMYPTIPAGLLTVQTCRPPSAGSPPAGSIMSAVRGATPLLLAFCQFTYYGAIVQLVRTPACHAGGRGFNPHSSRHFRELGVMASTNDSKSFCRGSNPLVPANLWGLRQVVRQQTLTLPPVVRIHQPLPIPHVPKTAFSGTRFRDMSTKTPFGVHVPAMRDIRKEKGQ